MIGRVREEWKIEEKQVRERRLIKNLYFSPFLCLCIDNWYLQKVHIYAYTSKLDDLLLLNIPTICLYMTGTFLHQSLDIINYASLNVN